MRSPQVKHVPSTVRHQGESLNDYAPLAQGSFTNRWLDVIHPQPTEPSLSGQEQNGRLSR